MKTLLLVVLLTMSSHDPALAAASTARQTFTFRQGVTLNHWTSNPIAPRTYADPAWFRKADAEWIAAAGLDHVQLIVSAREISRPDHSLDLQKLASVDTALDWFSAAGLGTVILINQFPDAIINASGPTDGAIKPALQRRAAFIGLVAAHYKSHGENLRFIVDDIPNESSDAMNAYFAAALAAIQQPNPARTVCLSARSPAGLVDVKVPGAARHVCVAAPIADDPAQFGDALDVFLWQHQFEKALPAISFPGALPALATLVAQSDEWAVKFSGATLDEAYLDRRFAAINDLMQQQHPRREFYLSHWRYVTGWPFNPDTVKDQQSIRNFAAAFRRSTVKHGIGWSVYDYNSGSCMRYPNGDKALILEALNLR